MRNLKEHLLQLGESVCDSGGGGGQRRSVGRGFEVNQERLV